MRADGQDRGPSSHVVRGVARTNRVKGDLRRLTGVSERSQRRYRAAAPVARAVGVPAVRTGNDR